jgi:hypothetical protein
MDAASEDISQSSLSRRSSAHPPAAKVIANVHNADGFISQWFMAQPGLEFCSMSTAVHEAFHLFSTALMKNAIDDTRLLVRIAFLQLYEQF